MSDKTHEYYEQEAKAFFEATVNLDPTPFLSPLGEALAPGARVLDIGCGSGRDLLWLKNNGFVPHGLEPSPALSSLAEKHSGCPVTIGDITTTTLLAQSWDGILISGVLVHVPHTSIPDILSRVTGALTAGGRLYVSVKEGHGSATDNDNRRFYYWEDQAFRTVAKTAGLHLLSMTRSASARGNSDVWLGYVFERLPGSSG
ncbi:SAM-dependent methyltransferase [Desulfoluna limicola]|uniref:SAM-dependent methyltransferase n=1 Tax=Desulfoluna limicola TaxID=2810562 RepID=A0ABM7PLF6_9BACT|nr:class I SAM-dependent methyltransferase [Desulfoluna limicola]BCS98359.1 SAM-dependent methyltransferase [Desulfoluna limicola]